MPIRFKEVTAQTRRLLDLGDQTIRDVRALVAMGAGNQKVNVTATQGRAAHLTYRVQSSPNYVWDRPLRNGGVTCAYGAGNCQDQAAVAYTILRSKLTGGEEASFCVNDGIHHSFATIGVPGTDPANEVICVDPWPIHPQALLLEDHFCQLGLAVLRHKPGGKGPNYMARLAKHAPADAAQVRNDALGMAFDVAAINSSPGMWNHQYCSRNAITWAYKVRRPWIADDQRPRCHACNRDFTFTRRRHHCRSCGEIFCGDCSTGRSPVGVPSREPGGPALAQSNGAVRVCAACELQIDTDGLGG